MEVNIKAIAVGRLTDNTVVALLVQDKALKDRVRFIQPKLEINNILQQVSDPGWRQKFGSEMGTWHIETDPNQLCFCALTRADYPEYHTSNLINEVKNMFIHQGIDQILSAKPDSYTKIMGSDLRGICEKYEDLRGLDKISAANARVLEVQQSAQMGIQNLMKNTEHAEVIADKANEMQNTAEVFQRSATQLKRIMYWRNLKLKIIIAVIILAVLLYFVVGAIVSLDDQVDISFNLI